MMPLRSRVNVLYLCREFLFHLFLVGLFLLTLWPVSGSFGLVLRFKVGGPSHPRP